MTDQPVPDEVPAELDPELLAELERALRGGEASDLEILTMVQGLHCAFHTVGADELHEKWWDPICADKDTVDFEDELSVMRYVDRLRDWVKAAGAETANWLWAHHLPHLYLYFPDPSSGGLRYMMIEAKEPADDGE